MSKSSKEQSPIKLTGFT